MMGVVKVEDCGGGLGIDVVGLELDGAAVEEMACQDEFAAS